MMDKYTEDEIMAVAVSSVALSSVSLESSSSAPNLSDSSEEEAEQQAQIAPKRKQGTGRTWELLQTFDSADEFNCWWDEKKAEWHKKKTYETEEGTKQEYYCHYL